MKKSKKSLVFLISIVSFIMLVTIGVMVLESNSDATSVMNHDLADNDNLNDNSSESNDMEQQKEALTSVSGLLVGFDKSKCLTDVIMVGYLDVSLKEMKLISIPRDIFIDFRDDKFKHIKERNQEIKINYCKLADLYWKAGKNDEILGDIKEVISIITGIDITYMATINTDSFKEVVDILGGVEFDVPRRMYYRDPEQGLNIDLEKGLQLLDGDKAEQLVRFRKSFKGGSFTDIQRIEVQQNFLIALTNQLFEIKDKNKIIDMIKTCYQHIETDFGLLMALDYVEYLYQSDLKSILDSEHMCIIPTYGEKIDELWYETWKEEEVRTLIQDLLNH